MIKMMIDSSWLPWKARRNRQKVSQFAYCPKKRQDNTPTPSIHSKDSLYHIQVILPTKTYHCPSHSMDNSVIEISNHFRKLFGPRQTKVHHNIEYHHKKLVLIKNITIIPITVPFENEESMGTQPVHHHSRHYLQGTGER